MCPVLVYFLFKNFSQRGPLVYQNNSEFVPLLNLNLLGGGGDNDVFSYIVIRFIDL